MVGDGTRKVAAGVETTEAAIGEKPVMRETGADDENTYEGTTRGLESTRAVAAAGQKVE